jgi:hypothetical protein
MAGTPGNVDPSLPAAAPRHVAAPRQAALTPARPGWMPAMLSRSEFTPRLDAVLRDASRDLPDRRRSVRERARVHAGLRRALIAMALLQAGSAHAADADVSREPDAPTTLAAAAPTSGGMHASPTSPKGDAQTNLILNGSFSQQPNPLAFWTNAPGAFVTWMSEGANASQGSAHVRFFPPVSRGVAKGAIYYTGLTQCVSIPGPGRYLLSAFARRPESASASSLAGVGWTLRFNSAGCTGTNDGNGRVDVVRSTAWTKSFVDTIEISSLGWTAATTLEIAIQVGDSSTASIEPVEALLDEIVLVEGPLFVDGFEE